MSGKPGEATGMKHTGDEAWALEVGMARQWAIGAVAFRGGEQGIDRYRQCCGVKMGTSGTRLANQSGTKEGRGNGPTCGSLNGKQCNSRSVWDRKSACIVLWDSKHRQRWREELFSEVA